MAEFTHLHTHSHYSLLNGVPKIKPLVKRAKELGMTKLALTDNGALYGAVEFYQVCLKEGIKPIIGVDAYVAPRKRTDMERGVDDRRIRLVLLAETTAGYVNLIKLVTHAHLEGLYEKPRIDFELLEQYHEGIIGIIPSLSGEHISALRGNDMERATQIVKRYEKVFGVNNTFLELTHHPEIEGHEYLQEQIVHLSQASKIPLVAAHNVFYLDPSDRVAREVLIKIGTGSDVENEEFYEDEDFSLIGPEQAQRLFANEQEALENNARIAERCSVEITIGHWYFPDFSIESGRSADDELSYLAHKGLAWRELKEEGVVKERLDMELKVIKDKGYAGYFLVVADLLREARSRGILTTIRGSVAGSLVTYTVGITNVNPLTLNLPFERFLNPHRPSAPDIDMDFADDRRDEMLEYVKEKYGRDNVAQIGTFGTMMARAAVRDVARALGYPYGIGDKIAKTI
jgi:DNA polymerase-3 subunit alpha